MILNTVCANDPQIDIFSPDPQNDRQTHIQLTTAGPQMTSFHSTFRYDVDGMAK